MEEKKAPENPFLMGLCITLGTVIIGLVSYIFYTSRAQIDSPRCEYNGWAYSDGQTFDSTDMCNVCFCNDGNTVCTQKACN